MYLSVLEFWKVFCGLRIVSEVRISREVIAAFPPYCQEVELP